VGVAIKPADIPKLTFVAISNAERTAGFGPSHDHAPAIEMGA
jgi:hypothetical protein